MVIDDFTNPDLLWVGVFQQTDKLVGKGYTVCERVLPLNFKALEQRLLQEFNQLRELEGAVDRTLSSLEGKT